MELAHGDGTGPNPVAQPSAPREPPDVSPTAHIKPDLSSGDQPAGPGAAGEALTVLTSFGRRLLVLVPVYLAGAMGLSVGFVLFGLALYLGWRRVRDEKERSLRAARRLLDDEERLTAKTLYMSQRELPAWVSAHPHSSMQQTPPPPVSSSALGLALSIPKTSFPRWDTGPQTFLSHPPGRLPAGMRPSRDLLSTLPSASPLCTPDPCRESGCFLHSRGSPSLLPSQLSLFKVPLAPSASGAQAALEHPGFGCSSEGSLASLVLFKTLQ